MNEFLNTKINRRTSHGSRAPKSYTFSVRPNDRAATPKSAVTNIPDSRLSVNYVLPSRHLQPGLPLYKVQPSLHSV